MLFRLGLAGLVEAAFFVVQFDFVLS